MLASRADCICAIPAKPPHEHPAACPVAQASRTIPFALAPGVELEVAGLPPVDWDNIQKDPRLVDLETLEAHEAGCQCAPCWRATLRMSNRPELAAAAP